MLHISSSEVLFPCSRCKEMGICPCWRPYLLPTLHNTCTATSNVQHWFLLSQAYHMPTVRVTVAALPRWGGTYTGTWITPPHQIEFCFAHNSLPGKERRVFMCQSCWCFFFRYQSSKYTLALLSPVYSLQRGVMNSVTKGNIGDVCYLIALLWELHLTQNAWIMTSHSKVTIPKIGGFIFWETWFR